MARRKLYGYLEEEQSDKAAINAHDAEDRMEATYLDLRERLGARHRLTIKAQQAMERVNNFKMQLKKALDGYDISPPKEKRNPDGTRRLTRED